MLRYNRRMGEIENKIRDDKGRFKKGANGLGRPITSQNAAALARKRWENYRLAALRRVVEEAKSIDPDISTSAGAYGLLMAKQYTALIDSDKPRMDDVEKFAQLLGGAPRSADLHTKEEDISSAADLVRELAAFAANLVQTVDRSAQSNGRSAQKEPDIIEITFDNSNYRNHESGAAAPSGLPSQLPMTGGLSDGDSSGGGADLPNE